jgi:hypothetical protein
LIVRWQAAARVLASCRRLLATITGSRFWTPPAACLHNHVAFLSSSLHTGPEVSSWVTAVTVRVDQESGALTMGSWSTLYLNVDLLGSSAFRWSISVPEHTRGRAHFLWPMEIINVPVPFSYSTEGQMRPLPEGAQGLADVAQGGAGLPAVRFRHRHQHALSVGAPGISNPCRRTIRCKVLG